MFVLRRPNNVPYLPSTKKCELCLVTTFEALAFVRFKVYGDVHCVSAASSNKLIHEDCEGVSSAHTRFGYGFMFVRYGGTVVQCVARNGQRLHKEEIYLRQVDPKPAQTQK
jgi:hypothetical protein